MAWQPDVSTSSVFVTLVLQTAVGAVVYLLFEFLRGQREVFWPKARSKVDRCPPASLSATCFGWIKPVLALDDTETLRIVGLDGYMFLRFLRLCATMALGCGAFACVFLLPIYATAFGDSTVVGISRLTMANIAASGDRLWAPFFCVWIFTLVFLYMLYKEFETFVTLRHNFLADGDVDLPTQQLYSVVAENIPPKYQSSEQLGKLFDSLFPGEVVCCQIGLKTAPLEEAIVERKTYLVSLEQAIAAYEASDCVDKPMVGLKEGKVVMCRSTEQVEAIPFYLRELQRLNEKIRSLKAEADEADEAQGTPRLPAELGNLAAGAATTPNTDIEAGSRLSHNGRPSSSGRSSFSVDSICATGFVTFRSKSTRAVASGVPILSADYPNLRALPAPAPNNIVWQNIDAGLSYIRVASMGTRAVLDAGLAFWALILAFISAISSLSNLEKYLPFLKQLDAISYALLEGQLPVIALIVFISLLPAIFTAVATRIERRKTVSDVQMEVYTWFFSYQIANVYLILLAGSIFGALSDVISDPTSIVGQLAASLPGVSTFFLNLMLTFLLSGVPLSLLRIGPAAIYKLYRLCFNERKLTRRVLIEGPLANAEIDYATTLPQFLYILCIALTYWVIAPILFFVAGLVFAANYVVYKYQLCYVIVNKVETGGMFWYKTYNFSMTGLMASAITMIGYMGIKEGAVQAPLLVPLPIIIYIVWCYTEEQFKVLSLSLTYQETLPAQNSAGDRNAVAEENTVVRSFTPNFFQHPAFSGPLDALPEVYRIREEGAAVPLLTPEGWIQEHYFTSTEVALDELCAQYHIDMASVGVSVTDLGIVESPQRSPLTPVSKVVVKERADIGE